jgi:hypothetical protein
MGREFVFLETKFSFKVNTGSEITSFGYVWAVIRFSKFPIFSKTTTLAFHRGSQKNGRSSENKQIR